MSTAPFPTRHVMRALPFGPAHRLPVHPSITQCPLGPLGPHRLQPFLVPLVSISAQSQFQPIGSPFTPVHPSITSISQRSPSSSQFPPNPI